MAGASLRISSQPSRRRFDWREHILWTILIVPVVVIAAFLTYVATKPDTCRFERSVAINASAETVIPLRSMEGGVPFVAKIMHTIFSMDKIIAVADIHAAIKQVADAGGEVLGEPMAIPGVGQYVSFMDTEGNRVSMLEPIPRNWHAPT